MRVAVYYNNSDVRLEERPKPQAGPGELLVRVQASGICGTDVLEWYRVKKAPVVLGHEVAGEVVVAGVGLEGYEVGDRVVVAHHVPCNRCHYCLSGHHTVCDTLRRTNFDPGGFAEYVRLPSINVDRGVYQLPDEVSFEEATFVEPLACVVRGMRAARFQPGQSMLVLGCGVSGLLFVQLAGALGAGLVVATDVVSSRLEAARQSGAKLALDAREDILTEFRRVNDGRLADLVVLCTGAPAAIAQALHSVERGGTVLVFAPTSEGVTIPLSINDLFWRNEITLTSSYGGSPADHEVALELIRARRVPVARLITHRLGLRETGLGFHLVAKAQDSLKVIIEPQR
ncbi:MAG: alcohol dehydrogenase catalytic domain-containing protein [Dehalococcoidia bacterium]|nr:alcohol dehydrogenase catalytic domain-containing protein [Dehalococcoidia bacterium]